MVPQTEDTEGRGPLPVINEDNDIDKTSEGENATLSAAQPAPTMPSSAPEESNALTRAEARAERAGRGWRGDVLKEVRGAMENARLQVGEELAAKRQSLAPQGSDEWPSDSPNSRH